MLRRFVLLLFALTLAACDGGEGEGPYFEFAGGGFLFNYRYAEATYGFVARVLRKPPAGGVLVAVFEDPAGGPDIVLSQPVRAGRSSYTFETPPVTGVQKAVDYRVELRLLAPSQSGTEPGAETDVLATIARTFRSSQDQAVLPREGLGTGPGYHRPDGSVPETPVPQGSR